MKKLTCFFRFLLPVLLLHALISSCTISDNSTDNDYINNYPVQPDIDSTDSEELDSATIAALTKKSDFPYSQVEWKVPSGPLTKKEKSYLGNWSARIEGIGSNDGHVALVLPEAVGKEESLDALVERVSQAMHNQSVGGDECVYLMFGPDHSGFWASCYFKDNEAIVMDYVNPQTGQEIANGVTFDWYVEENTIRLKFDEPLNVQFQNDSLDFDEKVNYWKLTVLKEQTENGKIIFIVQDEIPEYGFTIPIINSYEFEP